MFKIKDSSGFNRYIGASKAKVIDNRDPANRGRIQVEHSLLGKTSWIEYINDFGHFGVPAIGEIVYVQCDTGLYEYPFAWGRAINGEIAKPNTPQPFQRLVPTNRGLFSPGGNFIELDDGVWRAGSDPNEKDLTTDKRGIRISTVSGHIIEISDDPDGSKEHIKITDKSGDGITFNSQTKEVFLVSQGTMDLTSVDNMKLSSDKNIDINATEQENHTTKNFVLNATDKVQVLTKEADFIGTQQTNIGDAGGMTKIDGSMVTIAGPAGFPVARVGDRAFGMAGGIIPTMSTIIAGSPKTTSG